MLLMCCMVVAAVFSSFSVVMQPALFSGGAESNGRYVAGSAGGECGACRPGADANKAHTAWPSSKDLRDAVGI